MRLIWFIQFLVGGLEHGFYFSIYWESKSQLTFIFFRGVGIPPTRFSSFAFPSEPCSDLVPLEFPANIFRLDGLNAASAGLCEKLHRRSVMSSIFWTWLSPGVLSAWPCAGFQRFQRSKSSDFWMKHRGTAVSTYRMGLHCIEWGSNFRHPSGQSWVLHTHTFSG